MARAARRQLAGGGLAAYSAFAGIRPSGRGAAGIGAVVVANGDVRLDAALRQDRDERAPEIKGGTRGDRLAAY